MGADRGPSTQGAGKFGRKRAGTLNRAGKEISREYWRQGGDGAAERFCPKKGGLFHLKAAHAVFVVFLASVPVRLWAVRPERRRETFLSLS